MQTAMQSAQHPVLASEHRQKSVVTQRPQRTDRLWLVWVLGAMLLASVLMGVFVYFRRGSNQPVAPAAAPSAAVKTTLGLAVERRGDALLVTWNGIVPI